MDMVNESYNLRIRSYPELYRWSVDKISDFWSAVWQYSGIRSSRKYEKVVDDLTKFPGAKWFQEARLNFAENLLRYNDGVAFISRDENGPSSRLTYSALRREVGRVADWLREIGVLPGDRVAGYLPNITEAAIAMLGTTSMGAIWACCGAELGPTAVLDRLGQLQPRVLFTADEYVYGERSFNMLPSIEKIVRGLPSLKRVVINSRFDKPDWRSVPGSVAFGDLHAPDFATDAGFQQLPADHPVYIMFTSGTTGKPKCIVQGAAGLLVNQLKEVLLHADLKKTDRVMYITSPSWLMWNWLMSCLAVGATIILYDGNPNYPDWGSMWRLVQEEKATFFGCSASYINHLRSLGAKPGKNYDLSSLREMSQTASPLSAEGFEWVYREVKEDLHLNSISGGTDINGCFAGGIPILPVYTGELQAPGLGMKINVYDENGRPIVDMMGELVCEAPAPPMPPHLLDGPGARRTPATACRYFLSPGAPQDVTCT